MRSAVRRRQRESDEGPFGIATNRPTGLEQARGRSVEVRARDHRPGSDAKRVRGAGRALSARAILPKDDRYGSQAIRPRRLQVLQVSVAADCPIAPNATVRSEEHTSELQSQF